MDPRLWACVIFFSNSAAAGFPGRLDGGGGVALRGVVVARLNQAFGAAQQIPGADARDLSRGVTFVGSIRKASR